MSQRLSSSERFVAALVVSSIEEDQGTLRTIFAAPEWSWEAVPTIAKARSRLARGGVPSVVICECHLSDGDWKHLFRETERLSQPPKFIVSSRLADEDLWVEVLSAGAYDVLPTPFDPHEVSRVVRGAAESWHRESEEVKSCRHMTNIGRSAFQTRSAF